MSFSEDLCYHLMDACQCDFHTARAYLQHSNGDLEAAVMLYLDNGGKELDEKEGEEDNRSMPKHYLYTNSATGEIMGQWTETSLPPFVLRSNQTTLRGVLMKASSRLQWVLALLHSHSKEEWPTVKEFWEQHCMATIRDRAICFDDSNSCRSVRKEMQDGAITGDGPFFLLVFNPFTLKVEEKIELRPGADNRKLLFDVEDAGASAAWFLNQQEPKNPNA